VFSFTKKQEIFEISGVKIGGQPGEIPTVLFAGLFSKGKPDITNAKNIIKKILNLSKQLGNPIIPDLFIKKDEYIDTVINFIEKSIPKNIPFSIDIIDPKIKIKVLEILKVKKLLKRTIYNSIHVGITKKEYESLKKNKPNMIIIVSFNPKDKTPDGKLEVLENGANLTNDGLLNIAKKIGIKKILLDTAALAPGENTGSAIATIPIFKEEYGLPTGCAIHNVVEKSKWLYKYKNSRNNVDFSSNINIPAFGGDFVIIGPIQNAEFVLPIITWEDILISEYSEKYFGIKPYKTHPRRKNL
jgi:tetrahydromethanopterin S-methyltransferase subunit H